VLEYLADVRGLRLAAGMPAESVAAGEAKFREVREQLADVVRHGRDLAAGRFGAHADFIVAVREHEAAAFLRALTADVGAFVGYGLGAHGEDGARCQLDFPYEADPDRVERVMERLRADSRVTVLTTRPAQPGWPGRTELG
jgi:hypothetical protein